MLGGQEMPGETHERQNDHDILIEVRTLQKVMYEDLKELKDGTATRLYDLEKNKVNQAEFAKHELRLENLETTRIEKWKEIAIIQSDVEELDKLRQIDVEALAKRQKWIERMIWIALGGLMAIELILKIYGLG